MKRIDWTKWSAIAEILGAIAIVVTLSYLAIQTEQNTAAILSASRQAALEAELDFLYKTIDYPEMYTGTIPEFGDGLDDETKIRRLVRAGVLIRIRESIWLQWQSGSIGRDVVDGYIQQFLELLESDQYLSYAWSGLGNQVDSGFIETVNQLRE